MTPKPNPFREEQITLAGGCALTLFYFLAGIITAIAVWPLLIGLFLL